MLQLFIGLSHFWGSHAGQSRAPALRQSAITRQDKLGGVCVGFMIEKLHMRPMGVTPLVRTH